MNNGGKLQPIIRPTPFGAPSGIAVTSRVSVAKSWGAVFPLAGPDRDWQQRVPHHLRVSDIRSE
jgi:hypothetical protein